jgi:hypothetical protein
MPAAADRIRMRSRPGHPSVIGDTSDQAVLPVRWLPPSRVEIDDSRPWFAPPAASVCESVSGARGHLVGHDGAD